MTIKELASILNGRKYRNEITKEEAKKAKEYGLVVVFGASDDLIEFRGAIDDEAGASDRDLVFVTKDGLLTEPDCGCEYAAKYWQSIDKYGIQILWSPTEPDCSWKYVSQIPHETFNIMEDEDLYCVGIVFDLNNLK